MPLLMLYLDDDNKNAYRPLEFHLTLVNERSKKIYAPYKDENYELFKNEAFYYLEKYKTKCIKNNNVFTLISEECQFEDDKNAIGGYKCSDEGIWKNDKSLCVKVDCKEGYYLDRTLNKCIKDPCLSSIIEEDSRKSEESKESEDSKEKTSEVTPKTPSSGEPSKTSTPENNSSSSFPFWFYIIFGVSGFLIILFIILFVCALQKAACFKNKFIETNIDNSGKKDNLTGEGEDEILT